MYNIGQRYRAPGNLNKIYRVDSIVEDYMHGQRLFFSIYNKDNSYSGPWDTSKPNMDQFVRNTSLILLPPIAILDEELFVL